MNQTVTLPPVFGPTTIWFDDGKDVRRDVRDRRLADAVVPRPVHRRTSRSRATRCRSTRSRRRRSETRTSTSRQSRYGADGRLVVSSVFSQGYTVADMQCAAGGAPPCTAGDYDSRSRCSRSRRRPTSTATLVEGQVIDRVRGRRQRVQRPHRDRLPAVVHARRRARRQPGARADAGRRSTRAGSVDPTTRSTSSATRRGPIEIDNGIVCPLDSDFDMYKQWKLAPSGGMADCTGNERHQPDHRRRDPDRSRTRSWARRCRSVVGILRPVNIGSFNVWIVYPRGDADLTLQ